MCVCVCVCVKNRIGVIYSTIVFLLNYTITGVSIL